MSDSILPPSAIAVQSALRVQETSLSGLARTRMLCKVSSVALVVLFFVMTRTGPTPSLWLLAPLSLLVVLDICCLAGVRASRKTLRLLLGELQSTAADKLKSLGLPDLDEKPLITGSNIEGFLWSVLSPSVWLYYGLLAVVTAQIPANALSGAHAVMAPPTYNAKPSALPTTPPVAQRPLPGGPNNRAFPGPGVAQPGRPTGVGPSAIRPVSPVTVPQPSSSKTSSVGKQPSPTPSSGVPNPLVPAPQPQPGASTIPPDGKQAAASPSLPAPAVPKAATQPASEPAPPKPEPSKPEASAK